MKYVLPVLVLAVGCTSGKDEGQAGSIRFGTEEVELPYTGGVYELEYTTDDDFALAGDIRAVCGDGWLSVAGTDNPGVIEIEYSGNDSGCERESVIEVIYGSRSAYVEVHQAAEYGLEITGCNDYSMRYRIIPPDESISYLHGVADLDIYERFSSDSYFIDYIVENMREEAALSGVQFTELLSRHSGAGTAEYSYEGLEAGNGYIVFCCVLDGNYSMSGNMSRAEFVSGEKVSISLEVETDGPMTYISAIPTYDDRRYYFGTLSSYECRDNPDNIGTIIMDIIQTEVEYYSWSLGLSVAEYVENITTEGPSRKKTELLDEYEYYAVALCLSSSAELVSDVFYLKFKTGAVQPSDNVIKIQVSNLTASGCDYSVTVTNDDPYLFFIDEARNWEGRADEDLMNEISALYPTTTYGRMGNAEGTVSSLEPDTEYMAFAFGSIAGRPTTELVKVYFTTLKEQE